MSLSRYPAVIPPILLSFTPVMMPFLAFSLGNYVLFSTGFPNGIHRINGAQSATSTRVPGTSRISSNSTFVQSMLNLLPNVHEIVLSAILHNTLTDSLSA